MTANVFTQNGKSVNAGLLKQMRAGAQRALTAERSGGARGASQTEESIIPSIPEIRAKAIQNTRLYTRDLYADPRLSGDALIMNRAYTGAKARLAMQPNGDALPLAQQFAQAARGKSSPLQRAVEAPEAAEEFGGCKTCASRQYQDESHDSGVSYQAPSGMPAALSGVLVAAHESEHVTRESAEAHEEGEIITGSHVTMQMKFCPDCGRLYAAGGTTTIQKISRDEGEITVGIRDAAQLMAVGGKLDGYI